jgi:hypothetical protein
LLVIDGYEQISWFARQSFARFCGRHGCGLLVTCHRAVNNLPLLVQLEPQLATIQKLVRQLTAGASGSISADAVAASFRRHGGNVRETFFELYDRYERHVRASRIGNT